MSPRGEHRMFSFCRSTKLKLLEQPMLVKFLLTFGEMSLIISFRKRNFPTSCWNLLPQFLTHVSSVFKKKKQTKASHMKSVTKWPDENELITPTKKSMVHVSSRLPVTNGCRTMPKSNKTLQPLWSSCYFMANQTSINTKFRTFWERRSGHCRSHSKARTCMYLMTAFANL